MQASNNSYRLGPLKLQTHAARQGSAPNAKSANTPSDRGCRHLCTCRTAQHGHSLARRHCTAHRRFARIDTNQNLKLKMIFSKSAGRVQNSPHMRLSKRIVSTTHTPLRVKKAVSHQQSRFLAALGRTTL